MDIVIDGDSIVKLGINIFKFLIIAVILFSVMDAFVISTKHFIQGNKDQGYQFLIIDFMLIGSLALLFCIVYFGFGINLLDFLYK
ncbi:TPA: hypothetical protein PRL28_002283 [Staphylococcus aureus]|nr:hypothetical protein [Staphylococcus aureus]